MVHASQKGGWDCHTNYFFFLIIYIIVPLYGRQFYVGHIILVSYIACIYPHILETGIPPDEKWRNRFLKILLNRLNAEKYPEKI